MMAYCVTEPVLIGCIAEGSIKTIFEFMEEPENPARFVEMRSSG
jgi:hypothetical protein